MPKLDLSHPEREFVRGYYVTTEKFRAIGEHVAVMRKDGQLIAVVGPAASTGASEEKVREAEFFADLFALSPQLVDVLTGIVRLNGTRLDPDLLKAAQDAIAKVGIR